MLRDAKTRAIVIQIVGTGVFMTLLAGGSLAAWQRMKARGFAYGFDILFRQTGWSIKSPFLNQDAVDPYWWTLCVAFVDSAIAGLISIVLATLLGALIGVVVLMLVNLVASFFVAGGLGLRDGGPLAILFSLVVIGVAAFSLMLDFEMATQAVRAGAPAKFAWYIAFGLMTTLVWLYIEILRLLSYLRQE